MGRKVVTGSKDGVSRSFDAKGKQKIGTKLWNRELWFLKMFEC